MPIQVQTAIKVFGQEDYHALNRRVLRVVFDVQHEFVSTHLTPERRQQFAVTDATWQQPNSESAFLKRTMLDLLHNWGAFLEVGLYRDALTFLLDGPAAVQKPVEVSSGSRVLGTQTLHLLTSDTAFAISAVTEQPEQYGTHLSRFLGHTRLARLQWINLNHHQIEFRTLSNPTS
jgi:hypothetical protein